MENVQYIKFAKCITKMRSCERFAQLAFSGTIYSLNSIAVCGSERCLICVVILKSFCWKGETKMLYSMCWSVYLLRGKIVVTL